MLKFVNVASLTPPLMKISGEYSTAMRMETHSGRLLSSSAFTCRMSLPNRLGLIIEKLYTELGSKVNLIVGCDANAHHFQWGSKDTNARV